MSLFIWNLLIIAGYFVVVLYIGYKSGRNLSSIRDFAVSHKNYTTTALMATIFATVIGGGSTVGLAEKVYREGIVFVLVFFGMALNRILTAKYIAPYLAKMDGKISLCEVMENWYGKPGYFLTAISAFTVSLASVGNQVFAMGYIFHYIYGLPVFWGATLGMLVLSIYSSFGGARAVIATDIFQFILTFVFIPLVASYGLKMVGGVKQLLTLIPQDHLTLWNGVDHSLTHMFLFLTFVLSSVDPSFLQRFLIAKNEGQAVTAAKITGVLSFVFFVLVGFIGLIAVVLSKGSIEPNMSLFFVIDKTLPDFLKCIAVCALLAIVMSSADSDLHVVGLTLAHNIIRPLKKGHWSEKSQLKVAQLGTLFCGIFALVIALNFKSIVQIMCFSFSFWGPTVLVPLVAALNGLIIGKFQFIFCVALGSIITFLWDKITPFGLKLEGLVIGMLANFMLLLFFYITNKVSSKMEKIKKVKRLSIKQL